MKIREAFMFYVWQTKQFQLNNLKTVKGQELIIKNFGQLNHGGGPDFDLAEVIIGDITWVGSVEMHVQSKDWYQHDHNKNYNYDQVILHVVWEKPSLIENRMGEEIPTLWLKPLVDQRLVEAYDSLLVSKQFIPCENLIHKLDEFHIFKGLNRVYFEKLEEKQNEIEDIYNHTNQDLIQTAFIYFMRYFGLSQNQDGFEHLAKQTPYRLLQKYRNNVFQIEALLFGQAQMIKGKSPYALQLKKEYEFLKQKHHLSTILKDNWRFSGRPASFPTIRIAQLARIMSSNENLINEIINATDMIQIHKTLSVEVEGFWTTHYTFDGKESHRKKRIGKQFMNLLIINAIVPLQYFVSKKTKDEAMKANLEDLISQVSPEKNRIIRAWEALNIAPKNALDSQGLLHLYRTYCLNKNCLQCHIGHQVLKRS